MDEKLCFSSIFILNYQPFSGIKIILKLDAGRGSEEKMFEPYLI